MSEPFNVSPSGWATLELLRQQSGISFEVLHLWLHQVRAVAGPEHSTIVDDANVAEQVLKSVRTGEVRVDRSGHVVFGVFPLRRAREVVACLVAFRHTTNHDVSEHAADAKSLEETGALARAIIESDAASLGQVLEGEATTRRLHGILRFLGQLGGFESDQELMKAVLHAATVWFDLDCRIYQRHADGAYVLAAALPAIDQSGGGIRLEPARALELAATRRYSSAGDLEDLGFGGKRDEVLVLAVGSGEPEWIVLFAGAIDLSAELAFSAIARILTSEVQARAVAEVERWRRRLAVLEEATDRQAPERQVVTLFGELVQVAGASSGRLQVLSPKHSRTLVSIGQTANGKPSTRNGRGELAIRVGLSPETSAAVELTGANARDASGVVTAWIRALTPWLAGAFSERERDTWRFDRLVEAASFERRIQEEIERAKRFNLGLGLVLIGPGPLDPPVRTPNLIEALSATVRPELRSSDLLGRIRGGVVAVLLVHVGPDGADSVTARLRHRLSGMSADAGIDRLQLGQAVFAPDCATADDLIARAFHQAQALTVRH